MQDVVRTRLSATRERSLPPPSCSPGATIPLAALLACSVLLLGNSACHTAEKETRSVPVLGHTRDAVREVRPHDTFACLSELRRTILRVDGDFGYRRYSYHGSADGAVFDARGAKWNFQTFPIVKQNYPISIEGGAERACWVGGFVEGTNPTSAGWREMYDVANGAGFIFGGGQSTRYFTLDGIRLHNVWDGIRPRGNTNDFHISDVWITDARDDCVENDHSQGGLIEDSLFDGCHMGISIRPGRGGETQRQGQSAARNSSKPKEQYGGAGVALEVRETLMRLAPYPKPNRRHLKYPWARDPGHAMFFKLGTTPVVLKLHDNVFMMEQYPNPPKVAWGLPPQFASNRLLECAGNVLVWLGDGEYPGPFYNEKFPGCWTVTKDRRVWERAKLDWIDRHPALARLPGDPPSHPELAVGLKTILESVR